MSLPALRQGELGRRSMSSFSSLYALARLRREFAPGGDAERWGRSPRGGARLQAPSADPTTSAYPSEMEGSWVPDKWTLTSTRPYDMPLVANKKRGCFLQEYARPPPDVAVPLLWRPPVGQVIPPDRSLSPGCAGGAPVGRIDAARRSGCVRPARTMHIDDCPSCASIACTCALVDAAHINHTTLCAMPLTPPRISVLVDIRRACWTWTQVRRPVRERPWLSKGTFL